MSDDPLLQASAYLDGELSSDERARAEADPAVTALIARLDPIRGLVRDVEPLDDVRRDRLVAAALDATTTTRPPARDGSPSVVPLPSRPGAGRWLGVAAAVVVVAALGVVAVAALGGGSDDDSSAASDAASATIAASAAGDADTADRLEAPAATELTQAEAMTEMSADTDDGSGADAPEAASSEASERTVPADADASPTPYRVLSSPDDLAAFARDAVDQVATGSPPPDPPDCPDPSDAELVGRAIYVSTPDGVAVDVVVGIADDEAGAPTAIAIGTLTCDVVATSPLD